MLQATFDRGQLAEDDLSSIEISGLIPETVHEGHVIRTPPTIAEEEYKQAVTWERIAQGFGKSRKILEDLLGEVEASKIINSVPTDAALEVKVNIGYRATRGKLKREFMNNIADGSRNMPDGEIKVRGKNGEVKGDDLTSLQSRFVERAVERKQGKKFSEAQSDKPTASSVSNYGERLD